MTKALLVAAALGLSVAGANACEYKHSASAKVDNMTVASTSTTQSMSTPATAVPTDQVKDDAVQVDDEG